MAIFAFSFLRGVDNKEYPQIPTLGIQGILGKQGTSKLKLFINEEIKKCLAFRREAIENNCFEFQYPVIQNLRGNAN